MFFPKSELRQLTDALKAGDIKAVEYAGHIFDAICINMDNDLLKVESLLNSVMLELGKEISDSCKWLDKFTNVNEMMLIDISGDDRLDSIKKEFVSAVEKILNLLCTLRFSTEDNGIVKEVCKYILENIDEHITLKAASEALFMNKSYISEIFKQKTGLSFVEYLTIVKMERAKKLIEDGKLKAYEVAELLGFKDNEYFSRLFKKHTGITPTEYRQRIDAKS